MNPLLDPYLIPPGIRAALDRYVRAGIPPGDCLTAILSNNLKEAFARADDSTMRGMAAIVAYLHNEVPSLCWGSPARVDQWIKLHLEQRDKRVADELDGQSENAGRG